MLLTAAVAGLLMISSGRPICRMAPRCKQAHPVSKHHCFVEIVRNENDRHAEPQADFCKLSIEAAAHSHSRR